MKSPFALVLAAALPLAAAAPGTRTGSFAPGERVTPPDAHAPAAVSRTFVKTVTPIAGNVSLDLPVGGGGSLLVLAISSGAAREAASARIESPGGKTLAARQQKSEDLRRFPVDLNEMGLDLAAASAEVVHVERAEAGAYRFVSSVPEGVGAVTVVAAEPESPLTLSTWAAPLSRRAGEPVLLHAELADGGAALTGARVVARLAPEGGLAGAEIPLFDDGAHGDGAAGDGVYAARVDADGLAAGFLTARFDAEGRDAAGHLFARTGSGGLMNEPALARLLDVEAIFVGGERGQRLRVTADVDVLVAGDYRLDAIVAGAREADGSRPGLAWGEETVSLAKGRARVVLQIPAEEIGGAGRVHVDVRLLGLTTPGVAGRVEVEAAR